MSHPMQAAEILAHPDSMLGEALRLARLGFPVLPAHPHSKRPATDHGFYDATTNSAQITQWWSENPSYMIGIRTGEASGLAVLDLDMKTDPATGEVIADGAAALQQIMDRNGWTLPDTVEVKTPGGGRHLWFQHEACFRSRANDKLGIDTRAEGGYIISPPSRRVDGAAYRFTNPPGLFDVAKAPEWLADFFRNNALPGLIEDRQRPAADGASEPAPHHTGNSRPEDVERALADCWNPNDFTDWTTAALALHRLPGGKQMWLAWAARSPKFNRAENEKKWTQTVPASSITERTILGRVDRETLRTWGREHAAREAGTSAGDAAAFQDQYERKAGKGAEPPETGGSAAKDGAPVPAPTIAATPYSWRDPKAIPPRQWLYGRHLIRGFVSVTVAPGGIGKSSLTIADAISMISGRSLIGTQPERALNVWLFNLEDPVEEIERRIAATRIKYGIEREDCRGKLFVDSGRDTSLVIARQSRDGTTVIAPVVKALVAAIKQMKIDVLVVDPFVSSHEVPENDNGAIDKVAKTWARIAHETGCAIDLVHHSRKTGGAEVTIEHSRGAIALIDASRSARVLNVMTREEASQAGITENPRRYFSVENGKASLAPPPDSKFWFHLESVPLENGDIISGNGVSTQMGNGDDIGVVTSWRWPDPLADIVPADILTAQKAVAESEAPCRADIQAKAWAGHVIGEALGIDTGTPAGKAKVKSLLAIWMKNDMFREVEGLDVKSMPRKFIEVGHWANT